MATVDSCLFCKIVAGTVPARIVARDDVAIAFLDHRPVFEGHVLVAPNAHVETLTDLPFDDVGPLFSRVQLLAGAVQLGMGADGTFVAMNNTISQSVPHLHVHVVPRRRKDGLRGFFWPRIAYQSDVRMDEVVEQIRAA